MDSSDQQQKKITNENSALVTKQARSPNTPMLMMQFILDGCSSEDIAQVFGMRLETVRQITGSELFKSGLEGLRAQQDYELRSGFSGASREAFEVTRTIMRQGRSEQTRLRAAQHLLDIGGFRPEPKTVASVQQNNQLNVAIDIGDIVQRSQELAERNRLGGGMGIGNGNGHTSSATLPSIATGVETLIEEAEEQIDLVANGGNGQKYEQLLARLDEEISNSDEERDSQHSNFDSRELDLPLPEDIQKNSEG